jgi:hypothetical protein
MATAWISEYPVLSADAEGQKIAVAPEPATTTQAVTFSTSAQSAAFGSQTRFVRIVASADCHLLFGANPTATASHQFLPQGAEAWRGVDPGGKVAIYDGSS